MYNTSHQQSHSHQSRSPVDPQQQQQQQQQRQQPPTQPLHPSQQQHHPQQQYAGPSLYPPAISQQLPTPTNLYHPAGQQQPGPSPAAYSSHPSQPSQQTPDLLNPVNQRLRSGSGTLVTPELSQSDPSNLRRSSSLNDTMSNPQASYYPMASPMGGYPQHQMYSQSSIPQSSYYQSLPQLSAPLSSSYVDQPRQPQMRPLSGNYDYSQQVPYSQSSYPQSSYPTSYQSASSMMTPSSSPYSSQPPMAGSPAGMSYVGQRPSPPATLSGAPVHVVDRQKKPQCWDHGCNGREFSTFSNLLRHQREKSGTAAKSYCPHCGAEFTRTTARNGHMEHGKCKTRRAQGGSGGQ